MDSLRRSTRNTLLFTDVLVGLLPLGFLVQSGTYPGLLRFLLIVAGTVCFIVLHARGILQAINGEWRPFPLRRSYGLAGLGTVVACVGASADAGAGSLGASSVRSPRVSGDRSRDGVTPALAARGGFDDSGALLSPPRARGELTGGAVRRSDRAARKT